MMRLSLFCFILIFLSSCYSYKIFPKEYRNFTYTGEKKTAYVRNPELKKEYNILKASGIFIITNDSLSKTDLKVTLRPIHRSFICGNAIIVSAFTLGQFPVTFPDTYLFGFEESFDHATTVKEFKLQVFQRFWFWDMFAVKKNFKQKAGKTLLANYYKQP